MWVLEVFDILLRGIALLSNTSSPNNGTNNIKKDLKLKVEEILEPHVSGHLITVKFCAHLRQEANRQDVSAARRDGTGMAAHEYGNGSYGKTRHTHDDQSEEARKACEGGCGRRRT